jgi:hypothetical protein
VPDVRLRQKHRGKDEAGKNRGNDKAAKTLPQDALRQGRCLKDCITAMMCLCSNK